MKAWFICTTHTHLHKFNFIDDAILTNTKTTVIKLYLLANKYVLHCNRYAFQAKDNRL